MGFILKVNTVSAYYLDLFLNAVTAITYNEKVNGVHVVSVCTINITDSIQYHSVVL